MLQEGKRCAPGPTARKRWQAAESLICCDLCLLAWGFCLEQPFPAARSEESAARRSLEWGVVMEDNGR